MDLLEMLREIRNNPHKVFETNNGDLVGFFGDKAIRFGDRCLFEITDYKLNTMTFTEFVSEPK